MMMFVTKLSGAIGNIAGDSAMCRDLILKNNALEPHLIQFTAGSKVTMLRNATWTLYNFCYRKTAPRYDLVKPALTTLARIFVDAEEVLTDACWALFYFSDGTNEKIEAFVESSVVKRLVEVLLQQNVAAQTPSLRTVGNIVTGDDVQTQYFINVLALPCLLKLLNSPNKSIRTEASWNISTLTALCRLDVRTIHGQVSKAVFGSIFLVMHVLKLEKVGRSGRDRHLYSIPVDSGCWSLQELLHNINLVEIDDSVSCTQKL